MKNNQKIPEGWKKVKLQEICTKIGSGITPRGGSEVYLKSGIMFLRSQNILNGHLDITNVSYISNEIDNQMKSSRVITNDILYNITGASIGRSVVYKLIDNANVNQHVCIIRLRQDNPNFVNEYLLSVNGKNQLYSFQAGGNRQGLNYQQIGSYKLLLPSLPEQNRIVEVLENWGKYIDLLDQKIKIKKNIKKGLMQNLLTGKIRLKNFSNEWQEKRLGNISSMRSGGTPKSTVSHFYGGNIPWVSITDMTSNGKYIYKTNKNLTEEGLKNCSAVIFPKGTILYAMYASIGECSIAGADISSSQAILGIQPNKELLNSLFLYYWLTFLKEKIKLQGQQGTQSNLNADIVKKFELSLPSINEQNAIANVLTTADKEIETLEKQREIVKNQKKYLLNNLITGRIRVPEFANKN